MLGTPSMTQSTETWLLCDSWLLLWLRHRLRIHYACIVGFPPHFPGLHAGQALYHPGVGMNARRSLIAIRSFCEHYSSFADALQGSRALSKSRG